MRKMVRDLERARLALGDGVKKLYPSEKIPIMKMGKKLVAARPLAAGHLLTADDIAIKSPGDGLPAYDRDRIVGRIVLQPLDEDEAFSYEVLSEQRLDDVVQAR
jgi:N-acetylneuraminate synthase/sialic acid synthase